MSTRPSAFTTALSASSRERRSVTSLLTRSVRRPSAATSSAAAATCSARRDVGTTSAPASGRPSRHDRHLARQVQGTIGHGSYLLVLTNYAPSRLPCGSREGRRAG